MATPLAFGEVAVKRRIKAVLNYKKPAFWVICIGIIASVVVAIGFMTTPAANKNKYDNESGIDGIGNNNNDMLIYMQLNKLPNTRQHQVSKQAILVDNPLKINEKKYHYSLFYP